MPLLRTANNGEAAGSSTTVSVKTRNRRKEYMSVDPKTKSDRERYIRVAAIDIATNEGNWNIWVTEEIRASPTR